MEFLSSMLQQGDDEWLALATGSDKANVANLIAISQEIKDAYLLYDASINNHCNKPAPSNLLNHKALLKDFYEHPPTELGGALVFRRTKHGLRECPFCGSPFFPNTLDHFLPKDDWPEYSICQNNLVPQCKDCAPKKGKKYHSSIGNCAIFIHPMYFDILSKVGFKAVGDLDSGCAKFDVSFTVIGALTVHDKERIKSHMNELGVADRFKQYCLNAFTHWERKVKKKNFDLVAAFQHRIGEGDDDGGFSKNWKIAFYKAVLDCPELIAHLKQHAANAPPACVAIQAQPLVL